ncbi:palmitoyltransferase ZDHHC11 [Leguminivora glycinivorella]|uniref:palmitoyltransferase ZDHHC11 n=1 Tax=Leguminivora glycinivorella TaxID=1035111 RepID=UPI00200E7E45|nr:palmitoyltransferase ZDHHC11 [Leguminivora glycinivorella]
MAKCCAVEQTPRAQRRLHGLQLPLHYQQVIGWIIFLVTAIINFTILVNIQFQELKIISLTIFIILYVTHIVSHGAALLLDPSEEDLKKLKVNNVPEFDRSIHTHVIENGRCHLCNIYTSSKKTKHCSICNKCVDHFDHHCKWLNNCVGQRNYAAFITAAATALFISMFTSCLCLTDIILFLSYPQKLSVSAQQFINCSIYEATSYNKYCKNSICFLVFLIVLCVSAFAIGCALLHLCCFHVYIWILGVSTYEYIVKSGTPDAPRIQCISKGSCCRKRCTKKLYQIKKNHDTEMGSEDPGKTANSEANVSNLIGILINHELDKAKKLFLYDKNKIHPESDIAER